MTTPASQPWIDDLADVIEGLGSPDFPALLVTFLERVVPFDFSVMFAYRGEERPLDLFDNFGAKRRAVFVAAYQEGPYLLDPFYQATRSRVEPGLYRIRELAPDRFYQSEYFRSYYVRTGLSEEIAFITRLAGEVTVVISLMRAGHREAFSEREMRRLRTVDPVVRACARQHWDDLAARFTDSKENHEQEILARHLDYTFRNFGRQVLTQRECEVVGHVLRGHSSYSISKILGISAGTVKIHRKNIYAKLGISSQTELFSMFISTLSGPRAEIVRGGDGTAAADAD